jgi:hydrogenase maturation protease
VRVIGLGSPFGDDGIGWRAAELLAAGPLPTAVEVASCAAPASGLLPRLRGVQRVLLLDGVRGAASPGDVVRCTRADLRAGVSALSSHGVDLGTLLDLAEALGELPPVVELWGVEVDPGAVAGPLEVLSPAVAAALPRLVAAVQAGLGVRGDGGSARAALASGGAWRE